jgi:aminoglycoside 6'-N-acetyltransferase
MHFTFNRLLPAALSLIRAWLVQPHVAQWFGESDEWLEEIAVNLDADWVRHFRADWAGIPTGFVQCYDTTKAPQGVWSTQPPGTLGVDDCLAGPRCGYPPSCLVS